MIKEVKLKGWRSHWDSEFKFSKGTNALIGVMGAGKSSLLDSMCFALFGTFPALQARKLTLDDVIMNRPQRKDKAEVEISFQMNGDVYTVKRIIERGKGTTKAEIRKNGIIIDAGSSRTTENVEKILKVNYDLFSRAIYSEQNELDRFLTIPKGQRMKKMDSLLKIDRFEKARASTTTLSNRVKDNIKDKKKMVEEMEEREDFSKILKLREEVKELKKSQEQLKAEEKGLKEKRDKLELELKEMKKGLKEIKDLEKKINILSGSIESLSQDLESFEKIDEKNIEKNISEIEKNIREKEGNLKKMEGNLKEFLEKEGKCKISIEHIVERIENIKPVDGKCPVCNRKLTEEHKKKIIKESKEEMKKFEEELKKVKNEIKNVEEKISALRYDIEENKKRVNELEVTKSRAKEYNEKKKRLDETLRMRGELKEKLEKCAKNVDEEKIEKLEKNLQELYGIYSEVKTKRENYEKLAEDKKEQLKNLEERKKIFENYKKQIKDMENILENLKKLEKALKETQVTLRKEFIDAVNFTMDSIWEYLYPYQDLTNIRLSIKESDYSMELKESGGNWVPVEGIASGGERTTACLALRIAFALVLAPNLKWLILDEPTHNLDSQAVEYLAEVLRTRVGEFVDQVFLITHDEKLENAVTGYLYRLERKKEKNEPTQVIMISRPED